ncbi:MAG: hypothetical protein IJA69_04100 [Clostridia bacterium]|nr:hypothetical protein [Clostridia bacterium]
MIICIIMKYGDMVQVVVEKDAYAKNFVHKGMIGMLCDAEIRNQEFMVVFSNKYSPENEDIYIPIYVGDIEVVENGNYSDEQILKDLPKSNPRWWCKVENGYILNLLGEKKNKIPYDYMS